MLTTTFQITGIGVNYVDNSTTVELTPLPPNIEAGDNVNLFETSGVSVIKLKLQNPVAKQFFHSDMKVQLSFKAI